MYIPKDIKNLIYQFAFPKCISCGNFDMRGIRAYHWCLICFNDYYADVGYVFLPEE